MGIANISNMSDYNSFNVYSRVRDIPAVKAAPDSKTGLRPEAELPLAGEILPRQSKLAEETGSAAIQTLEQLNNSQTDHRSKTADLEEVSLTFNKKETFDYIGRGSGLENLDMQKAISDMQRDEILQGYQYFVGSAKDLVQLTQNEDGAVFRKLGI